jgi:hypothetical protein
VTALGCKGEPAASTPTFAPTAGFAPAGGAPPAPSAYAAPRAQTAAPVPPPIAQPAAPAGCRAAGERLAQISPDRFRADETTAACESERWVSTIVACIARSTSRADLQACEKALFAEVKLEFSPQRTFDIRQMTDVKDPPIFTLDGDLVTFRANGQHCGMIGVQQRPAYASFLVCGDKVLAGPLTTDIELKEAMELVTRAGVAEINAEMQVKQAELNLSRSVMQRWPSGGGTTTVYDRASGRPLYQTY